MTGLNLGLNLGLGLNLAVPSLYISLRKNIKRYVIWINFIRASTDRVILASQSKLIKLNCFNERVN